MFQRLPAICSGAQQPMLQQAPAQGFATLGGLQQARVGRPCVNLFRAQVVDFKTLSGTERPRRLRVARLARAERSFRHTLLIAGTYEIVQVPIIIEKTRSLPVGPESGFVRWDRRSAAPRIWRKTVLGTGSSGNRLRNLRRTSRRCRTLQGLGGAIIAISRAVREEPHDLLLELRGPSDRRGRLLRAASGSR